MAQIDLPYQNRAFAIAHPQKTVWDTLKEWSKLLPWLVAAALLAELFTPFLIWKRILPSATRWLGDLFILMIIGHTFWRMLRLDKTPAAFLLLVALTIVSSTVAWYEGQAWQATAWGIWLMFKYPMVGIYVYLHRDWLPDFPKRFVYALVGLLAFEAAFQVVQFGLGAVPDDNLAGSFGKHGVAPLLMLGVLVTSFGFGHWLVTNTWRLMGAVVLLAMLSSILGEMKVYPLAVLAIALICMTILIVRNGKIGQALIILVVLSIIAPIFMFLYNSLVADARGTRRIEEYFDPATTEKYLQNTKLSDEDIYYFGRGFAMEYAWNAIQRDNTTLMMGYGIGARADSESLGILGEAVKQSDYGRTSGGTSMLILLQEMGIGGMAILGIFVLYYSLSLYYDIGISTDRYANTMRYGLLLFTVMWPIWLWYTRSWFFGAPMILYWVGVGYSLAHRPSKANMSKANMSKENIL